MQTTVENLVSFFLKTRNDSEKICKPLEIEDYVVQPVDFVSPPKWHLAHITWFFEEFILKKYKKDYQVFHNDFSFLFNSYYNNVGKMWFRPMRGNLSRPTVHQIYDYRHYVTDQIEELFSKTVAKEVEETLTIGIHHEKQHQELLLTDIKYILGHNPLFPKYDDAFIESLIQDFDQKWIEVDEGLYEIGHQNSEEFCYDNELKRHKVWLNNYKISNKLVTNSEYIEFIDSGGYRDFNLWHSDGWAWLNREKISKPMYWYFEEGQWFQYTLGGLKKINPNEPLSHISYYEAFAFAQWKGLRLPTEFEWEAAQHQFKWGSRWEWTESAYLPYPGFQKAVGAIGEYNGKFMVDQRVLRGASVATSAKHSRPTYRNFFQPYHRWQFTGIRLAK